MSARLPATGGLPVVRPEPLMADCYNGLFLASDLHLGAANTDEEMIRRDLDRARLNDDRILLGGDIFDLILPGDRKRYTPAALHPRFQGRTDIVNAVVEWAADDFLAPYADHIDFIGTGNHETAVEKVSSYDTVRELVKQLQKHRDKALRPIQAPGYTSYIQYQVLTPQGKKWGLYNIWQHHGTGSTKSAPEALAKLSKMTTSFYADLYWSGHSHSRATASEVLIECGPNGKPLVRDVRLLVTGSYLTAYGYQSETSIRLEGKKSNYASDSGMRPHGMGGSRLVLTWDGPGSPSRVEVVQ